MRPFLCTIGGVQIPSFFFFIMIATLACVFYCYRLAQREGLRPEVFLDMGIIGMLAGIIGSRIFHILVEAPAYYWEKPLRVFEFWRGGFVSWGAFLSIIVSIVIYFRIKKLPIFVYFDLLATGAPLIKFFVRLACLLAGCCYGEPTNVPWAITFTDPNSTAAYFFPNTPLHPVQVYSMIHAVLLFFLVNWVYFRTHKMSAGRSPSAANGDSQGIIDGRSGGRAGSPSGFTGQTTCILVMGWTLPRAVIEFWRADSDRGLYFDGMVSTGQIMGGSLFLAALLTYLNLYRRHRNHAGAA